MPEGRRPAPGGIAADDLPLMVANHPWAHGKTPFAYALWVEDFFLVDQAPVEFLIDEAVDWSLSARWVGDQHLDVDDFGIKGIGVMATQFTPGLQQL